MCHTFNPRVRKEGRGRQIPEFKASLLYMGVPVQPEPRTKRKLPHSFLQCKLASPVPRVRVVRMFRNRPRCATVCIMVIMETWPQTLKPMVSWESTQHRTSCKPFVLLLTILGTEGLRELVRWWLEEARVILGLVID